MMVSMETQTTPDSTARLTPLSGPGPLLSETTLTLHTVYAWQLIHGRPKNADSPAIIGLLGFASMLNPLAAKAKAGSVAAVEAMGEIDNELKLARKRLKTVRDELDSLSETTLGIGYSMPVSVLPVRVSLKFLVPQAYLAARLVAEFDQIMCWRSVLARTQAVSASRSHDIMRHSGRSMRRLLASVLRVSLSLQDDEAKSSQETDAPVDADLPTDVPAPNQSETS